MFTNIKRRSENLAKDKGSRLGAVGGGPGIGPGAESDALAGDESAFDPGAMAAHHAKMADFHASKAGPIEGSPEEEAGELPDFEATEDAIPSSDETETPAEAFGETPVSEAKEGPFPDELESPDEAAAETPADEEAEKKPFPPPKKKGQSAFNSFRKGGY